MKHVYIYKHLADVALSPMADIKMLVYHVSRETLSNPSLMMCFDTIECAADPLACST
jgi:hypothetical protein